MKVKSAKDVAKVHVEAGTAFLEELQTAEIGSSEDGNTLAQELVDAIGEMIQSSGNKVVLSINCAKYLLNDALPHHVSIWGNWGWDGASYVRSGQALLSHLRSHLENEAEAERAADLEGL